MPDSRPPTDAELHDRDLVDLSALRPWRAVLTIGRRPTSEALVPTRSQAHLVTTLNVTPVSRNGDAG